MPKAILLSAGRGERLKPLTDTTPKPLIVVAGKPLIVHHLEKLAAAGITDIVINVSYLAEKIIRTLGDGKQFGVTIQYTYEPVALETGGGIFQALPLLSDGPFLAISSDIYTDYPFEKLLSACTKLGHLVLVPNPPFHPNGDYGFSENNMLTNVPAYTYASFGVLHPHLFQHCKTGAFRLSLVFNHAIANRQLTGEVYQGFWYNVGDIQELNTLQTALSKKIFPFFE